MKLIPTLSISLALVADTCATDHFDPNSYHPKDVIYRDVAVIGGGMSGTYAAVRLTDLNTSVVVIEKEDRLGGHVNTYTDPSTGAHIDFGVQTWFNYTVVRNFFARLSVPTAKYAFGGKGPLYLRFDTGDAFPNWTPSADFQGYSAQLAKYPYLTTSWTLPDPVPGDLLLTWEQFLTKYSLGDVAYTVWSNAWGVGNALKQLTVYMLKAFDQPFIDGLTQGTITTADHNNQGLFDNALEELGDNVLLSSTVAAGKRSASGSYEKSKLVVNTPTGKKLLVVSKIIMSAPQLLSNMDPLGLDQTEQSLFKQFSSNALYVFLISNTGLQNGFSYLNADAESTATFGIPSLPGLYNINPTIVDGVFSVWYGSEGPLSEDIMKQDITATVARLNGSSEITFLDYASHTPFNLHVSSDNITNGFYDELQALQGYRNTWYTGSAFLEQHAAALWNFTEYLLPKVIAS